MRRAELWESLGDHRVQCRLCSQFCIIPDGETGRCGVRENHGGELRTLVYGRVAALNLDPVEKKPLYHFLPGTRTLSFGTSGCNFSCAFCQNDELSQGPRNGAGVAGQKVEPEELVTAALRYEARSLSYTYSEPTIFFEFMRDTARRAVEAGLKNILVSNGFQSPACLEALGPLIQAANIDLKAFTEKFYEELCGARLAPVLENLKTMRGLGWWLEVTTLVIPGRNDSREELERIAGFIAEGLGPDTPWHVSRFHPEYRLLDLPSTPLSSLETALDAGRRAGLRHVYIGNVPGHDADNTFCAVCGARLVERMGFAVTRNEIREGKCPHCGAAVPGVWV